jgi:multidrug efflux system membrane fusion protein
VKEGNIVKAEDDRLVTINQVHPIYVAFSAPEQELAAIRKQNQAGKLAVSVNAPDSTNTLAVGQLAFIDNAVDPSTGTILLKGAFQNTNDVLWPGQFVQVHLRVDTLKQATVVPSQAVQSSQNGDFVFVVLPDSTVEKRSVTLGLAQQGFIVIESGLKPGETVVTDGQMKLAPKSKVSIQKSAEAPVSPEDVKPLDGGTA